MRKENGKFIPVIVLKGKKMKRFILFVIGISITSMCTAFKWPHGAKSAVSITADDGWWSETTEAQYLERYGWRGTFYLSGNLIDFYPQPQELLERWKAIASAGHELGNHTYSHASYCKAEEKYAVNNWKNVADDISDQEKWLWSKIYGNNPESSIKLPAHTFTMPYGIYFFGSTINTYQEKQVGVAEYAACVSLFAPGARIANFGAQNDPLKVARLRYLINSENIDKISNLDPVVTANEAIDKGIQDNTWTVLTFHTLEGDKSCGYTVTDQQYIEILDHLKSKGTDVWIAPVIEILNYIIQNTPPESWGCTINEDGSPK